MQILGPERSAVALRSQNRRCGDNPRSEGSRELGYIAIGSIIGRYRGNSRRRTPRDARNSAASSASIEG